MAKLPRPPSNLMLNKEEFDHIFNDVELQQFLDKMAGGDEAPQDVPLQFMPAQAEQFEFMPGMAGPGGGLMAPNGPSASSATSSFEGQAGLSTAFGGSSAQAAAQMAQLMGSSPPLAPPIVEVPGPLFRANSQQHAPPRRLPSGLSAQAGAPVPSLPMPAGSFLMPGAAMAMPPPALRATSCKAPDNGKPQISHSTVEKQRRDRINSLIDELRELVPPQKGSGAPPGSKEAIAANSEARRPKHVVLADTIALLKQMQILTRASGGLAAMAANFNNLQALQMQRSSMSGQATATPLTAPPLPLAPPAPPMPPLAATPTPTAPESTGANGNSGPLMRLMADREGGAKVKEEQVSPSNSNSKSSVSSQQDDVEMKDEEPRSVAPRLPHIPIQPTQMAGVVVEKGPDCMYVQVKCRDRKGLLSDIINALKTMALEIRTAAVTTTPDGLVRDVFEVRMDDETLQPDEVQNLVHEALFQPYALPLEHGKRARS